VSVYFTAFITSSPKNQKENCDVDLSLDSRLEHRSQEVKENEEEEEDDEDEETDGDGSESEEELNQDGVYVEEDEKDESGIWKQLGDLLAGHKRTHKESSSTPSPAPGELINDNDKM